MKMPGVSWAFCFQHGHHSGGWCFALTHGKRNKINGVSHASGSVADNRFGHLPVSLWHGAGARICGHLSHRFARQRVYFDLRLASHFRLSPGAHGAAGGTEHLKTLACCGMIQLFCPSGTTVCHLMDFNGGRWTLLDIASSHPSFFSFFHSSGRRWIRNRFFFWPFFLTAIVIPTPT